MVEAGNNCPLLKCQKMSLVYIGMKVMSFQNIHEITRDTYPSLKKSHLNLAQQGLGLDSPNIPN